MRHVSLGRSSCPPHAQFLRAVGAKLFRTNDVIVRFRSPHRSVVLYRKSWPYRPVASPFSGVRRVAIRPIDACLPTSRFTRMTLKFSPGTGSRSWVWTLSSPRRYLPIRPLSLPPPMRSTVLPSSAMPMRRLKKGMMTRGPDVGVSPSTAKLGASSRKNCRFSGKNSEKRVRLTCASSTSASEKSVFSVRLSVRPGVSL